MSRGDDATKKSMPKLFQRLGSWSAVPELMIGTIHEKEDIRRVSLGYLRRWKSKAVNFYLGPEKEELERARKVFRFAYETHEEKQYFKENPLNGFSFFFGSRRCAAADD